MLRRWQRARLIDQHGLAFVAFCRRHRIRHVDAARSIFTAPEPSRRSTPRTCWSISIRRRRDHSSPSAGTCSSRAASCGWPCRVCATPPTSICSRAMPTGFVRHLQFDLDRPRGPVARLRGVLGRGHGSHWMYDRNSLVALVGGRGLHRRRAGGGGAYPRRRSGRPRPDRARVDSLCLEARRPSTTRPHANVSGRPVATVAGSPRLEQKGASMTTIRSMLAGAVAYVASLGLIAQALAQNPAAAADPAARLDFGDRRQDRDTPRARRR